MTIEIKSDGEGTDPATRPATGQWHGATVSPNVRERLADVIGNNCRLPGGVIFFDSKADFSFSNEY